MSIKKKIASMFLCIGLFLGLTPAFCGTAVSAGDAVAYVIDEHWFPDQNFRSWLLKSEYNWPGMNALKFTTIPRILKVDVSNLKIRNLKGVELFTSLKDLDCSGNRIPSLDLNGYDFATAANGDNQIIPALNITGKSGAWKYDMSVLNISDLSKVTIADGQSAVLDKSTGIVTFTTAKKPTELKYTYDTGATINTTKKFYLNVTVVEKLQNLDFVLTHNSELNYTVKVDNVPAGRKLLFAVNNGTMMSYSELVSSFTEAVNGTDQAEGEIGHYIMMADGFNITEIANNEPFAITQEAAGMKTNGFLIAITDAGEEGTNYLIYAMGMTPGSIAVGSSSGNKLNASAHNVTVTGGTAFPDKEYKNDTITITASNPSTFDHWTSASEDVVFADAKSATTTFAMIDADVSITAVDKSAAHSVTITSGKHMSNDGNSSQSGITGAMKDTIFTADDGYYFPEDYAIAGMNGISVTRLSASQLKISGTPSADTTIILKDPTPKNAQETPNLSSLSDSKGSIIGTTAAMEYSLDRIVWVPCTDDATVLKKGTYFIRYKTTDTKNASDAIKFTVAEDPAVSTDDSYIVPGTAVKE
jgi:hypothetical protein